MDSTTNSTSTTISTSELEGIIQQLEMDRFRSTMQAQYYTVWKLFNKFFVKLDRKPLTGEDRLVLFVGYLIQSGKKSTTIKCYISAIKAVLANVRVCLNEDRFLLNSLIRACRIKYDRICTRIPIKKGLLKLIVSSVGNLLDQQPYLATLYKALMVTAYFGLFRIGKVTYSSHVVKASDVHTGINKDKILFVLRSSKTHNNGCKPQQIKITATGKQHAVQSQICHFSLIRDYLAIHKRIASRDEQFFIFYDRSLVKSFHFRKMLKMAITAIGLDSSSYDSHCLRAGRSLDLFKAGVSVETIKKIG